jgi:hypothetical protein
LVQQSSQQNTSSNWCSLVHGPIWTGSMRSGCGCGCPIWTSKTGLNRTLKHYMDRRKPVFCHNICCTNTTYPFLNKYYPYHLPAKLKDRYNNYASSGPTFKTFHQELTEIRSKQKYIVLHVVVCSSYNLSGMLNE